jgi:hypothetical protein
VNDQKQDTSTFRKTLSAYWDEMFRFKLTSVKDDCLQIALYDWDMASANDLIGTVRIAICRLDPGQSREYTWTLTPVEWGKPSGVLTAVLHVVRSGMRPFVSVPFPFDVLHIRLGELTNFKGQVPVFLTLQLSNDRSGQDSSPKDVSAPKVWNTDLHFFVTPDVVSALTVRLIAKELKKDSVVSEGSVPLAGLSVGATKAFLVD